MDWMPEIGYGRKVLNPLLEGTLAGFTSAGILATIIFQKLIAKSKVNWFYVSMILLAIISLGYGFLVRPAGTATLTCYLLPYFIYPIREMGGIVLPEFFRTGTVGIVKSLVFALLVVMITGVLERQRIKLKL